jgi:riboflavin synthase
MSANKRFGGHMVQGHIDDTATIVSITPEGNSLWYKLQLPNNALLPYIIPKGFIALDGTSLTVCDVNDAERWFTIMMIAHTQDCVVMAKKQPGDRVNVEVDMVGKYALKSLEGAMGSEGVVALVKRLLTKAQ